MYLIKLTVLCWLCVCWLSGIICLFYVIILCYKRIVYAYDVFYNIKIWIVVLLYEYPSNRYAALSVRSWQWLLIVYSSLRQCEHHLHNTRTSVRKDENSDNLNVNYNG